MVLYLVCVIFQIVCLEGLEIDDCGGSEIWLLSSNSGSLLATIIKWHERC